jgi:hypothetical protein
MLTEEQIRADYLTLLNDGHVTRELDESEHDVWRKQIRRRCRQDKLKVETGPAYNADAPPVAVEALLVERSRGTYILAQHNGEIVGRKLGPDEDETEAMLRFTEDLGDSSAA